MKRETLILIGAICFFATLLFAVVQLIPKDTPPDPVVLHFETRHELYHISGQYRVIVFVNGQHRGSFMMSRTELKRGLRIETDYRVDLDVAEGK